MWPDERRKNAHRCGAKDVSKSKCTKHTMPGALLEVAMSKKCTPFWREHISKSKCTKHTMLGPLLEVKMMKKCTPLWREDARSIISKSKCTKHTMPGALLEVVVSKKVHAVVARSTFGSQKR